MRRNNNRNRNNRNRNQNRNQTGTGTETGHILTGEDREMFIRNEIERGAMVLDPTTNEYIPLSQVIGDNPLTDFVVEAVCKRIEEPSTETISNILTLVANVIVDNPKYVSAFNKIISNITPTNEETRKSVQSSKIMFNICLQLKDDIPELMKKCNIWYMNEKCRTDLYMMLFYATIPLHCGNFMEEVFDDKETMNDDEYKFLCDNVMSIKKLREYITTKHKVISNYEFN